MPESLLTILKLCALALLYLFFLRVVRAVWAEVNADRVAVPATVGSVGATSAASAPTVPRPSAAPRPTRLLVVEGAGRGTSYALGAELTMGRAPGCSIHLDDGYVSSMHARVFSQDGTAFLEDLGSTNGTWLNGAKVGPPVQLSTGDQLTIGSTTLEVAG